MIKLDTGQQKQLSNALKKAFPTKNDLKRMVHYSLGENLEEITSGNLENAVFELILWAISRGRIVDLVNSAHKENDTNPELLEFYQEVWKPLVDAKPPITKAVNAPIFLGHTTHRVEESTPLLTPRNDEVSPDPIDTTKLCSTESLRTCLLTHTKVMQESLQKARVLFAQTDKIYLDRGKIACKHIKQKSDILHVVLSELLKIQQVDTDLHTKFQVDKDDFWQAVEKVVLPILEKPDSQLPLAYNRCQSLHTELAVLEQNLASINHQICAFCNQVDPSIDIYQFDFVRKQTTG